MKQILIADDHEVVRSGLRAIIETRADWIVGGEATDGKDAVALALKMKPDVAIVDYSMPVMNGLEVSRRIKLHHLPTEVLILTMHEREEILTEALLAGVRGFLLKSDARSHLITAIEALLDHRPYFTSILLEKLLHEYQSNKKEKSEILLSSREQSVVQLIAEGHTNKSVGAVLNSQREDGRDPSRIGNAQAQCFIDRRVGPVCNSYKIDRALKGNCSVMLYGVLHITAQRARARAVAKVLCGKSPLS